MTDTPSREEVEALANALQDHAKLTNLTAGHPLDSPTLTGNAAATLRALLAQRERDAKVIEDLRAEPKVKPLEWEDIQADSVFGVYDFGRIGGIWTLRLDGVDIETGVSTNFRAAGGDAKAAAQADYERRILSALAATSRQSQEPCGECHLQPGETCDICGRRTALAARDGEGE